MATTVVEGVPAENSPVKSSSFERKPIGNTPAEVGDPGKSKSGEIEPAPPSKRREIMQVRDVRLPASTLPPVFQKVRGRIAAIDAKTGVVHVELLEKESLPAGAKIRVFHKTQAGEVAVHMKVLKSVAGSATAELIDGAALDAIAPGDKTISWKKGADE